MDEMLEKWHHRWLKRGLELKQTPLADAYRGAVSLTFCTDEWITHGSNGLNKN